MPRLLVCALVLFISCQVVLATEYFVSNGGSDSGLGDAAHPWATLQYAADHVAAGDNVNVLAGNYTGAVVALDPKTGAILAMVSKPSYDPNTLSVHTTSGFFSAYALLTAMPV